MLRDRLWHPRWLLYLTVAWGTAAAAVPAVEAAPLPPAAVATAAGDLDAVRALLERRIVSDRLAALGVSPAEAVAVLDRLTPDERAELASRAQELGAAGDSGVTFLAFAIIVALVVILVLELLGRRVISRP
jgi:hypothetical protein